MTVTDESTESSSSSVVAISTTVPEAADVTSFSNLIPDEFYSFHEAWCIVNHKDFVYIWNEHCAIELSHNSNGWYRFLINNKLCSMYSNGQPEMGAENDENLPIFFNKLLRATERLKANSEDLSKLTLRPLFRSDQTEIKIENWVFKLVSNSECNELHVANMFADQTTIFKPDTLLGFSFESNKRELIQFTANPEAEMKDLKAEWSYIEKLIGLKPSMTTTTTTSGGNQSTMEDATKLRHLKRLQRLNEEPNMAVMVKPPRSQKPSLLAKSSIPVTNVKLKKVNEQSSGPVVLAAGGSVVGGTHASSRLSALQQYLTSISSKSGQLRQNQLKQNVNK